MINLSIAMNSDAFRGLSAALLIFIVVLYLMNWGFTIWRIASGVALGIPQQREEEDEDAKKKAKEEHDRLYRRCENNQNGNNEGDDDA